MKSLPWSFQWLAALVLLLMPLTAVASVFTDSIGSGAAAGCGTDWEGFDSGCETYSDHDANKSQCCWVVVQFDTTKAPVYRKNVTLRGEFLALGKDAAMSIVKTYNNGSLLAGTAGISDDPSVTCETRELNEKPREQRLNPICEICRSLKQFYFFAKISIGFLMV